MRHIQAKDRKEYRGLLSEIIVRQVSKGRRVLLIDCMNCIDQHIFGTNDIATVMKNLYVARIEQADDLAEILMTLPRERHYKMSDLLIVSSFERLLDGLPDSDQVKDKIARALSRLRKDIIMIGIKRRWDTQYRLKDG